MQWSSVHVHVHVHVGGLIHILTLTLVLQTLPPSLPLLGRRPCLECNANSRIWMRPYKINASCIIVHVLGAFELYEALQRS